MAADDTKTGPTAATPDAAAAVTEAVSVAADAPAAPTGSEAPPETSAKTEPEPAPDIGSIAPVRDAALLGANIDPGGSMLGRGVVGAVLAHAVLAAVIVLFPAPMATWSGGGDGDGIDVDLVSSGQLTRIIFARPSDEAMATDAVVNQKITEPVRSDEPTALIKAPDTPAPKPEPDDIVLDAAKVVAMPRVTSDAAVKPDAPEPDRTPPKVDPTVAATAASDGSRAIEESDVSSGGGAKRFGATTSTTTVNALPGEIAAYNRMMVERIDRCKPKDPPRMKGIVWISYVVDSDGSIERAYVDQSSGVQVLDALALDALRTCRFNAPLAGLARDQRFYRISYTFK